MFCVGHVSEAARTAGSLSPTDEGSHQGSHVWVTRSGVKSVFIHIEAAAESSHRLSHILKVLEGRLLLS